MRRAIVVFAVLGPGVELALGPYVLTGFERGDGLPGGAAAGALGWLLLLAAVATTADALVRFARAGGTPSPLIPASRPIREGVYARLRHPLYVATTTGLVGEALVLRRPILLAAAAAYAVTMALVVRYVEEPRLRRRFGQDWRRA